ncbi:MAG: hypothetical protein SCARUB_01793 [Candidatus Scalindua rubra]|uniref:Uncharacterized protein n=1 Tax=Candidatus Scalindua rubra TaxID=1872076 RepID=A0A1E3XDQ9_9BACT|nr:MAG: hypothetical protein SCARUB_01793 [Candidatus Scalindua rubra]
MDIDMEMVLWCAVVVLVFCIFRLFAPIRDETQILPVR